MQLQKFSCYKNNTEVSKFLARSRQEFNHAPYANPPEISL